jgi:hypothetical protein
MMVATIYVVRTFSRGKNGELLSDQPSLTGDAPLANRLAKRLARRKAGVLAFSRTVEANGTLSDEAVVLASYGHVPCSLFEPDAATAMEPPSRASH